MSSEKAITTASRRFVAELTNATRARQASIHPAIVEEYVKLVGGPAVAAKQIREDMARVRGENLSEEDRACHRYAENTIQKYHQMVLASVQARDQQLSGFDASAFSEDELKAVLFGLAMEIVREDAAFRQEVAREALREDPDLLSTLFHEVNSGVIDVTVQESSGAN